MSKPLMSFPNQAELNAWNRLKTPIWIFDLQDLQMWWANEAALPFWQAQTLEELLQRNWQTISPAGHARLQHYAQRLQRGETISEQWTFYPKGNPISTRCTCSGINLPQGNLAMLVEGEALSQYESTEMNNLRALEAFRHSSALISLYDLRGNLLLQNPIAQAAYPEQMTLASRFREAVSMLEILEPLEAQQTYHFEAEVQTKYGQRWHHLELAYTNDPVTGDKLIILTETDISHRKQVQGKYQQTSDQLEAVLNAIPGFVSWIDQQGHYLGVNDNLAQAFGRKKQDFIGQSIGSLSGNKKLTQTFHDFFQSHQKQLKQETFAQLNGENHYYLLMAQKYNQQQAAVTVGIDITERKQTQQQLKEQLKHSLLLKGITNKIRSYLKTEDIFTTAAYEIGKAFAVSRCLILSYQPGCHHLPIVAEYLEPGYSAVKDQYPDFFLPNHPSLQKALTVNHSLTFPQELSTSILNKLASKTELILRTSYQDQANGVIIFQQCDIQRVWQETEIQILEEIAAQLGIALAQAQFLEQEKAQRKALEKAKQEAEAASRGKSEFLAMMSHEIRTPLNSVIGMTDLLLETEITEEQKEYLQLIQTSGDTLLTIIHDLLDFSKIEAGHLALDKKPFDLYNCLEKTLGMLAAQAFGKGLNLAYRIAPNTPTAIIGDVTRIQQILLNLIGNALKFTEKGEVTVTVSSLREQKPIQLQFEIADTGIGIGSQQRDRLFKPFSQGDASTTRRYGGTGLGLVVRFVLAEIA